MRVFYSELSANPGLYSFGYSIYGELEPNGGDSLDECYEKGFLPFVGTEQQKGKYMYMGRGTRVLVPEFSEKHYHARVRRKVAHYGEIVSVLHPLQDFLITDEFIHFVCNYFTFRFGKGAMPETRLRAILHSGFVTHIREFKTENKTLAYILEVHGDDFVHTWYHAYAKEVEGSHVGAYLYIDLLEKLKAEGKKYLYLGITYGTWMSYKTNFQPLSYWDGQKWIADEKDSLKKLLRVDALRQLTFTDPWRESLTPFYKSPYTYGSVGSEIRLLMTILNGLPKLSLMLILSIAAIFLLVVVRMLVMG